MTQARIAFLLAATLLVAACSSGGPASPSTAPSAGSEGTTQVDVQLTDSLKIEPAAMSVPANVPVTFVVTNTGTTDHEFFLGDEAAQDHHEQEMAEMGGMAHDEPMGIGVKPGETKELTVTFTEAGAMLAGCHLPGHYAAGMVADVQVGP